MADTRVDELRRRLERDPGSRLFAQLAEELRKSGDLPEAIRVARAGLAVHTAYPSARLTLGRALLESGDPAAARTELESALRDAPDNILASRFLAQAREAAGDLRGAADQYKKTLTMAPGDRQLQSALAGVEARLAAPAATAGAVETTPPPSRPQPPPLPATASADHGASPPPAPAAVPQAPRAGAPPVVSTAARPQAAAPEPPGEYAGGLLPPTLRIHASQTVIPPPPPPPAVPPAGPPEPAASDEAGTLPGGTTALAAEAPAPAASPEPSPAAPFSSPTLAELYHQQGLVDRAVDVYRQVVQQEPGNDKARARLAELEGASLAPQDRAARRLALERTIAGLETLLGAVRRR